MAQASQCHFPPGMDMGTESCPSNFLQFQCSQISVLSLPACGRREPITPKLLSPWGFLLVLCHREDSPKILLWLSLCRIHLEDLSQSVLLHMTEKLGYKNSDVINTVLSNRASHTLAIYFLLNKKLERYLASLRVSTAGAGGDRRAPSGLACWHFILQHHRISQESSPVKCCVPVLR